MNITNLLVTHMATVKLSGSQNHIKSHNSGKETESDEEGWQEQEGGFKNLRVQEREWSVYIAYMYEIVKYKINKN